MSLSNIAVRDIFHFKETVTDMACFLAQKYPQCTLNLELPQMLPSHNHPLVKPLGEIWDQHGHPVGGVKQHIPLEQALEAEFPLLKSFMEEKFPDLVAAKKGPCC